METKDKLSIMLQQYIERGSKEKVESEPLKKFLERFEGYDLIDRKNFDGHITASAFVVNEEANALLLLKHKALNRWLQPGGHIDVSDNSVADAALRETCEETGLGYQQLTLVSSFIFDIDSHDIPANHKKSEPAHVHHDVRYLFRCNNSTSINISLNESTDSKWVPFVDLATNTDFNWAEKKIKEFIRLPASLCNDV